MTSRQEGWLTWLLIGLCGVLVAVNLGPRLWAPPVAVIREQPPIVVSIAGAVRAPGVYELPWGSRVADLIEAAGGLTADAEATLINPAMALDAGGSVFVPQARADSGDPRISLNSALPRELDLLPGIGPVLAERIIAARPFFSVDELLNVPGIGAVTLERLRPLVKP
jgi:competence protein ComEA